MKKSSITEKSILGFTLAEVLITLTIIGVIAALTIPSLITNIQDARFKTSYRKAFAAANQAILKANAGNLLSAMGNVSDPVNMPNNFNAFMNQFVITKSCPNDAYNCWDASGELLIAPANCPYADSTAFIDNSGMEWSSFSPLSGGYALIVVDTNGNTGPNRYGKDRWFFQLVDATGSRASGIPIKVVPYYNFDIFSSSWSCHYPPCYNISWLEQ